MPRRFRNQSDTSATRGPKLAAVPRPMTSCSRQTSQKLPVEAARLKPAAMVSAAAESATVTPNRSTIRPISRFPKA